MGSSVGTSVTVQILVASDLPERRCQECSWPARLYGPPADPEDTSRCTWAKAALSGNQADERVPMPFAKVTAEHLPGAGIVTPQSPQGLNDPGRPPLRLGFQLSFRFVPICPVLAVEPTMLSPDGPGPLRDLLVARCRSLRADRVIQPIGNQCGPTRLLSVPRVRSRRLCRSGSSTAVERLSDALAIHLCLLHRSFLLMDPTCIPK